MYSLGSRPITSSAASALDGIRLRAETRTTRHQSATGRYPLDCPARLLHRADDTDDGRKRPAAPRIKTRPEPSSTNAWKVMLGWGKTRRNCRPMESNERAQDRATHGVDEANVSNDCVGQIRRPDQGVEVWRTWWKMSTSAPSGVVASRLCSAMALRSLRDMPSVTQIESSASEANGLVDHAAAPPGQIAAQARRSPCVFRPSPWRCVSRTVHCGQTDCGLTQKTTGSAPTATTYREPPTDSRNLDASRMPRGLGWPATERSPPCRLPSHRSGSESQRRACTGDFRPFSRPRPRAFHRIAGWLSSCYRSGRRRTPARREAGGRRKGRGRRRTAPRRRAGRFEVAAALGAPLDVIVVRKLGIPFQPELAMGAVGEGGVRHRQ